MYRYSKTLPTKDEAHLARLARDVACQQLHIREPSLHFIRESPAGDILQDARILGFTQFGEIFIVQGQRPRELVKTTFHECRHIYQFLQRGGYGSHSQREHDAFLFEHEFAMNLNEITMRDLIAELICRS